jgi:diguanylate cyclase (GGDEF)-like protein
MDGMPFSAGLIGQSYRTGETVIVDDVSSSSEYLMVYPGHAAELCVPIVADAEVVGVINCVRRAPVRCIASSGCGGRRSLGARLAGLGGTMPESPAQRLVRHAGTLAGLETRVELVAAALEAARDISGMDTAALIEGVRGQPIQRSVQGQLGAVISEASEQSLEEIIRLVSAGVSVYTVEREAGQGFSSVEWLAARGAQNLLIVSFGEADVTRVLLLADGTTRPVSTDTVELVEMLCAHLTSAMRASDYIDALRVEAATDGLTGLGHHRSFYERLPLLARSEAVVMIDVDRFKQINDIRGHQAGDTVLQQTAAALGATLRDDHELFRIGDDEFAAILSVRTEDEARLVAARLCECVRMCVGGTVSVGAIRDEGETHEDTLGRADDALYEVKAAGRDGALIAA